MITSARSSRLTLVVSMLLHAAVFITFLVASMEKAENYTHPGGGGYMPLDALAGVPENAAPQPEEATKEADGEATNSQPESQTGNSGSTGSGNLFGTADSSSLKGIYAEPSLGVSIRYPNGWTFMDQSRKRRLDGVTFLGTPTVNGEVPYVHIKVQEKYLFNPSRYMHTMQGGNYSLYYNEPEVLEGQYSLEVYVKTETENDFSIKLIIHTEAAFKEFKPVFLAMVKTFAYKGM